MYTKSKCTPKTIARVSNPSACPPSLDATEPMSVAISFDLLSNDTKGKCWSW
jgi:hypothetical protein